MKDLFIMEPANKYTQSYFNYMNWLHFLNWTVSDGVTHMDTFAFLTIDFR